MLVQGVRKYWCVIQEKLKPGRVLEVLVLGGVGGRG